MKKIALIIDTLNTGGAQRAMLRLADILGSDYDVTVIVFDLSDESYEFNGNLINLSIPSSHNFLGKIAVFFKRVKSLKKLILEQKFDVAISFLGNINVLNILAKTKNKVVASIRNHYRSKRAKGSFALIQSMLYKILYKRADKIVTVSKVLEEEMKADYGLSGNLVTTIYNPYNISDIIEQAKEEIEDDFKPFFADGKTITAVGRIMHQKGFWHLVKAFSLVLESEPQAKLVIVGKDYDNNRLSVLIDELGLAESVLLLGYQKNPFKYVSRSCVYVLSSLFEGFPNVLAEAMCTGVPVIATDCKTGPREILYSNTDINLIAVNAEDADFGVLVPPLSNEENFDGKIDEGEKVLAGAIIEMLSDSEKQAYYKEKAPLRAAYFNYDAIKRRWIDVIEGNEAK